MIIFFLFTVSMSNGITYRKTFLVKSRFGLVGLKVIQLDKKCSFRKLDIIKNLFIIKRKFITMFFFTASDTKFVN